MFWSIRRHIRSTKVWLIGWLQQLRATFLTASFARLALSTRLHPWPNRYFRAAIRALLDGYIDHRWKLSISGIRWAVVAASFIGAPLLISLLREIAVLLMALLLNRVSASPLLEWPVRAIVPDPIYSGVGLEMLGNINARGFAVSGSIGDFLHTFWPALFVDSDQVVAGSWVSAVTAPGSSVISQFLAAVGANGLLIFLGVMLVGWALRRESLDRGLANSSMRSGLLLFGVFLQARSVLAIMSRELTPGDLENLGITQIATKLFVASQQSFESNIAAVTGWLSLGLRVLAVVVIYIAAFVLVRLFCALVRLKALRQAPTGSPGHSSPRYMPRLAFLLPAVAIVAFASSPFGTAATNFSHDDSASSGGTPVSAGTQGEGSFDSLVTVAGDPALVSLSVPSVVSVTGGLHNYVYVVNGKRDSIRGIGYNVIYRHLSKDERSRRYDRDFARMRAAGVNTILGWDADKGYEHDKFDDLLLDKANKHGIGVLMPFYLPPDGEYSNPEYRKSLQDKVIASVRRFKNKPSLRMWAIGNEVMHDMPSEADPAPFAEFYLKLADAVHREDPNHPVIYRDAEDAYLGPFKYVLAKSPQRRPWLIYGMNIFTFRIGTILTNWEREGIDAPVLVSEFGPSGLSPQDRPDGLVEMWRKIRSHHCSVLGGIVYVWTTAGPEPVDRVFGLVDEHGNAVDDSLYAIAREFRQGSNVPKACEPLTSTSH
ncbi:MAG: glycoside hydrolase family 2 TIM barrel-domain containing protein [Dehalococcoidia bacterium]|nr:glycoside hydrolase family 2 TIM barrel-domain containing protein [Dehalococcoidia bacterium]